MPSGPDGGPTVNLPGHASYRRARGVAEAPAYADERPKITARRMQRSAQLPREVAYERAERAMVTAARVVPSTLAQADEGVVLVLDIAGLGQINAHHGFAVGDRLLADIEAALRQQFRGRGCVARLPGDQFVAVLPHRTAMEHAIVSARQAVGRVHL